MSDNIDFYIFSILNNGKFFNDKDLLKRVIFFSTQKTLAHEQASRGWITNDIEILELKDKYGWSVAHEQALHGWVTNNDRILFLKDNNNVSVFDLIFQKYGVKFLEKISFKNRLNFLLKFE